MPREMDDFVYFITTRRLAKPVALIQTRKFCKARLRLIVIMQIICCWFNCKTRIEMGVNRCWASVRYVIA